MSKLLLFLLFPFSLFAQERSLSLGAVHHPLATGGYGSVTWSYPKASMSLGLEYLKFKEGKGFVSFTSHLGINVGRPQVIAGFGAGNEIGGSYGAFAEAGAGITISCFQLQVLYRSSSLNLKGAVGKIGFCF